jgi:hypothetical protein
MVDGPSGTCAYVVTGLPSHPAVPFTDLGPEPWGSLLSFFFHVVPKGGHI